MQIQTDTVSYDLSIHTKYIPIHTDTSDTYRYIPDTDFQYLSVSENEYREIQSDTEMLFPIHTEMHLQVC